MFISRNRLVSFNLFHHLSRAIIPLILIIPLSESGVNLIPMVFAPLNFNFFGGQLGWEAFMSHRARTSRLGGLCRGYLTTVNLKARPGTVFLFFSSFMTQ
ncbi:hypothetical protein C8J56DRAFT_959321 [Mycena floridula]|nr:hypothetical protein C8J56DRAFT_959321 [Mycena floridula]